jgi:hypothetical protein
MSAYVTYNVRAFDADGQQVAMFPVRAVCAPTPQQALDLAREHVGEGVMAAESQRSVPPKIGRVTPATRRVSARVKLLA